MKDEISLVHDRLDEKIMVIDNLENRILEIEKKLEYERGLSEAQKEMSKVKSNQAAFEMN